MAAGKDRIYFGIVDVDVACDFSTGRVMDLVVSNGKQDSLVPLLGVSLSSPHRGDVHSQEAL